MFKTFVLTFIIVLLGWNLSAHEFHVGLCYSEYEEESGIIFSSIQLESRDFAHWMEDLGLDFNLEELVEEQEHSEQWDAFESFILIHFAAEANGNEIEFYLFDIELENDGRLFLNILAKDVRPFSSISWKFSLLMGHSMDQQNKLEFKYMEPDKVQVYFAYFFETETHKTIAITK